MMNEPAENDFKHKIRTQAYPTVEAGGIIWAYMGPPEQRPPAPNFLWTQASETQRHVTKVIQECNWLQALEGGIDTSHAPILHRSISSNASQPGIDPNSAWARSGAPKLELDITDYGYRYAGVRTLAEGGYHIRAYHFVLPFHQLRPSTTTEGHDTTADHIWVPMDDGNTMIYNWQHTHGEESLTEEDRLEIRLGNGPEDVNQETFRSYDGRHNDYGMDRQVQKYETFTGIRGVNKQDRAIQESMGRIVDRTREHLGPADRAIIQARRLLLQAVKTVQEEGVPDGIEPTYYQLRAGQGVIPADMDWRQLIEPELSATGD